MFLCVALVARANEVIITPGEAWNLRKDVALVHNCRNLIVEMVERLKAYPARHFKVGVLRGRFAVFMRAHHLNNPETNDR